VDYQGFKNEEAKLDQYLKGLENTDTKALSRNEQFAFYVNAYNAWTIKLILGGYPGVKSIKDLGSLFKTPGKRRFAGLMATSSPWMILSTRSSGPASKIRVSTLPSIVRQKVVPLSFQNPMREANWMNN